MILDITLVYYPSSMSQTWCLGWPLTREWAVKYYRLVINKDLPLVPNTDKLNMLAIRMRVEQDISDRLPLEAIDGFRLIVCWYGNDLTPVFSFREMDVDCSDELPRKKRMEWFEMDGKSLMRLRKLLGMKHLMLNPMWLPTMDSLPWPSRSRDSASDGEDGDEIGGDEDAYVDEDEESGDENESEDECEDEDEREEGLMKQGVPITKQGPGLAEEQRLAEEQTV